MTSKKLVIIDTDGGVDDALAIMLATYCHKQDFIDILAITCTHGNTAIDNVCKNVCYTLRACDLEQIKVYRGCEGPIIGKYIPNDYHGEDGLGDSTKDMPPIVPHIESEHAVNALVRLSREYANQITIVTLGPLSNIGTAYLLDNNFYNNLKQIVFMGGCVDYVGNIGPVQEFNIQRDAEACSIMLSNAKCPLISVPWECGLKNIMTWEIYDQIVKLDSKKAKFAKLILQEKVARLRKDPTGIVWTTKGMILCDILAVMALGYDSYIESKVEYKTTIELNGQITKGELVLDRGFAFKTDWTPVTYITHLDETKFSQLLIDFLK